MGAMRTALGAAVRVALWPLAPPCVTGLDDCPMGHLLARAGVATAALWWLWLAPLAAWLSTGERGWVGIDMAFAAIILMCAGAVASLVSLVLLALWREGRS